jgi:osmotically-inducible protein OsmY
MKVSVTIPDKRPRRRLGLLRGLGLGAAAAYFLDPDQGRRRRKVTLDRVAGTARRTVRRVERLGRGVNAWASGRAQRLRHLSEAPKDLDDATLARKVETEIFRSPDVPKGQIDVNAQHGVVQLRGEVPSVQMIDELVARTRAVRGVRSVESLLHLPGTPAPMHE